MRAVTIRESHDDGASFISQSLFVLTHRWSRDFHKRNCSESLSDRSAEFKGGRMEILCQEHIDAGPSKNKVKHGAL